jgi:large subunit ribosomal protein L3
MANINTIIGIKGEMTTRFAVGGKRLPVTQIIAAPSVVAYKKGDKIAIGYGKSKKPKKPQTNLISTLGFVPKIIKEVKVTNIDSIKDGDQVTVSSFTKQDLVKITGTTKGHGFAGGIKRWGFHGGPKTHGQSDRHRAAGSIGQGTTPGRVYKGKHMAGHYGASVQTTTNIEVFAIDEQNNIIEVIGAVPGHKNGILIIEKTGKAKAYVAPPEEKKNDEEEGEKENKETKEPEESKKDKKEEK